MSAPFPFGVTVTVQRSTRDRFGDATYVDHHKLYGCGLEHVSTSEQTDNRDTVIATKRLYAATGSDVLPTDRLLLHPPGVVDLPPEDAALRARVAHQVVGDPADWQQPMTGWAPGMVVELRRVDG